MCISLFQVCFKHVAPSVLPRFYSNCCPIIKDSPKQFNPHTIAFILFLYIAQHKVVKAGHFSNGLAIVSPSVIVLIRQIEPLRPFTVNSILYILKLNTFFSMTNFFSSMDKVGSSPNLLSSSWLDLSSLNVFPKVFFLCINYI